VARRLRFPFRRRRGTPPYEQLRAGGRASDAALAELILRHGDEAVDEADSGSFQRFKPYVFAIDARSKETVYIERHEDEFEAAARINAINGDASENIAVGIITNEYALGRMGPRSPYRIHRLLGKRRSGT
jgi:hypothetical protein